jgi:hypothetical protein
MASPCGRVAQTFLVSARPGLRIPRPASAQWIRDRGLDRWQWGNSEAAPQSELEFICPECRAALHRGGDELRCHNGHCFAVRHRVFNLLPANPAPSVIHDAAYHAAVKDQWLDLNQLDAERTRFYHQQIADYITERCGSHSRILEIGGEVGFDLQLLMRRGLVCGQYVFSEISEDLCRFAANRVDDSPD